MRAMTIQEILDAVDNGLAEVSRKLGPLLYR